ncbi:hypothetical protein ACH474_32440 [Nocardia rhamnosiphila]|jgi:hypothetical protein|uniref:Uncharacterized protein n=1 Tax=Nocardia rhamnosiphila TaxID=426716 RepID=A0ABV2WV32_9NOCA|nr:hypothetical protein [Nocardia rhamnosiphila]
MTDTSQAYAIRASVDQLLAAADPFDPATVAAAFATELREILCSNSFMREFTGSPSTGPFEGLTVRIPRPYTPASLHLTALSVRAGVVVRQDELRGYFAMPRQGMALEPHTPPEGVISFREEIGDTVVFLDLTAKSRTLTTVALHRHASSDRGPESSAG